MVKLVRKFPAVFMKKTWLGNSNYPCLSILLATSNYRARGTFGPSMLNYSLNGAANA